MPHVSVVIPTRNRSGLLRTALVAALGQREVDLEVLVVDDGSKDDTVHVVTELADTRIRLLRERGVGVSGARNAGVAAARGEWIAFLDDDDMWAPDKLSSQLASLRKSGRRWVYTGDVGVDENLRVLVGGPPPSPEEVLRALPRYNPVPAGASNVLVGTDALARAGPFDVRLRRTEDWDLWIRLARIGPPSWVRRPLVAFRVHTANVSADTQAIIREPDLLAARYRIPVDRAAMQRRAAWFCLRAGDRRKAVAHYARAVAMGDVTSVGRGILALTHPAVGSDRLFGLLRARREDESWRAEGQAWLDELREQQSDPGR